MFGKSRGTIFIGSRRKNICIIWGNITINYLFHKDLIHLSDTGLTRWVFGSLEVMGDWDSYITSLHENGPYGG